MQKKYKKIDYQRIKVCNSTIKRVLKAKSMHIKNKILAMLLNTNQMKKRKEFSQNYIESDYTKMMFIYKCFF